MDTIKISDSTKNLKVSLNWSPNIKPVTLLNNHRIEELYSLEKSKQEDRELRFVCNQIIHSYIFTPIESEKKHLVGFYFVSDKDKNEKLFYISVNEVIKIFNLIGNDYPTKVVLSKEPNSEDFSTNSN